MDRTCICLSDNVPVTPTRCPTWLDRRTRLPGSTTSTDAAPFLRNALFQLRAFGASTPSVSVSRYVSFDRSRQPKIVTGAVFAALVFAASVSLFGVGTGDTSTILVDTIGFGCAATTSVFVRASVDAERVPGVISRAAITMTAPVTHMAVTSIAPEPNRRLGDVVFFELSSAAADDFFEAAGAFERVAF